MSLAPDSANPLLAFVHVPKTAGTSLQAVLEGPLMNGRPAFNIAHPNQARAFLSLPKAEQDRYYAVFGHMPFGVDRYVERPVTYITFLRDPVERTLSAYAHSLRHPEEQGSDVIRGLGLAWAAQTSHVQTSRLADHDLLEASDLLGRHWVDRMRGEPREHLEQAKRNLERCAFIGLHESYAADVSALQHLKGRRIVSPSVLPREKLGENRLRQTDLKPEDLRAIRAANAVDSELYAHAEALRNAWGGPVNPEFRRDETWTPLALKWWWAGGSGVEVDRVLPDTFETPADPWFYGAISDVLPLASASTLRIRARVIAGAVGFCLLSSDAQDVLSEQRELTVGAGEETLFLTYGGERPAKLCIRNFDNGGEPGRVELLSVEATPEKANAFG